MYSAYQLNSNSRNRLLRQFPSKYAKTVADHITVQFGGRPSLPPPTDSIRAIGLADDNRGIQALIVSVNGTPKRPDGSFYHITWSLNATLPPPPQMDGDTYQPKHSNLLIQNLFSSCPNPEWTLTLFPRPVSLSAQPVLKYTAAELSRQRKNLEF